VKKEIYVILAIGCLLSAGWFFEKPTGWVLILVGIVFYFIYLKKSCKEEREAWNQNNQKYVVSAGTG